MANLRKALVDEARHAVETNHAKTIEWFYSEGADRLADISNPWAKRITADCSAFIVYLFVWLGLRNPDGSVPPYYTGTELTHGQHISVLLAKGKKPFFRVYAGCTVVYGPGTGEHTAFIVEVRGHDILTVSMGQQGDPSYVWVNPPVDGPSYGLGVDGRMPQTFLRFNTKASRRSIKSVRSAPTKRERDFVQGIITDALA
jgi:hypothetical protein